MAWWRRRRSQDFDEEILSHVEAEEARLRDRGVAPDEARRRARVAFGGVTQAREGFRERSPWHWFDTLWQDARYGARLMRRSPAFTITAVVVLALGIGANATLFSVINGLFLRDLHVRQPEQLVYLQTRAPLGRVMEQVDRVDAAVLRDAAKDIAEFSAHLNSVAQVTVDGETFVLNGEIVEPNYFDLLGVSCERGRSFRAEDDEPSNPELSVVVSHDFWTKRLASDAGAIGRLIRIEGRPVRIIGIAQEGFRGLASPFRPSAWWVPNGQVAQGRGVDLGLVARLEPGLRVTALQGVIAAKTPGLVRSQWERMRRGAASIFPWEIYRNKGYPVVKISDVDNPAAPEAPLVPSAVLAALATVSVLVLVIACANIAGLLLARGTSRTGEIAVRQALGAAGRRLFRQVLTESLLLSGAGALLGVGVATAFVRVFTAVTPEALIVPISIDVRVLAFAVCGALATGILVGLTPALQATRVQVLQALGSGVSGSRGTGRSAGRWIVIPQVAVSVVLLLAAAVHVHALQRVEARDLGYRTSGTTVFEISRRWPGLDLWTSGPLRIDANDAASARASAHNLLDAVAAAPGVDRFATVSRLPLDSTFSIERRVLDQNGSPQRAASALSAVESIVSDGYFDLMDMDIIAGRTFDARERAYGRAGLHAAVVSASVAEPFGGADLVGRQITLAPDGFGRTDTLQVIGIVNDVDPVLNDGRVHPVVYQALNQQERPPVGNLLVRGHGDASALMVSVRKAILGADPSAEIARVRPLDEMADEILYPRRLAAAIVGAAATIGLGLACLGLYGIVSYAAAQRTREFGIRAALGATRQNIVRLVLRDGAIVLGAGISLGLALGVVALRVASSVARGLPTFDGVVFVTVPLALVLVVLVACLSPALRAARIDPAQVIRGE